MMKLIAAGALALATQAAQAERIDFNQFANNVQGLYGFTSGSLTFSSTNVFAGTSLGVWTTAPDFGDYNGSPYLLDDDGDRFKVQSTAGGAFMLRGFDAALGWYAGLASGGSLVATYALASGGTEVDTYALGTGYQTFSPGVSITSATFEVNIPSPTFIRPYVSFDNLEISAVPVPEPAPAAMLLAGLFAVHAARHRRRRVSGPLAEPVSPWGWGAAGLPCRSRRR